jgi:hypothetical protein
MERIQMKSLDYPIKLNDDYPCVGTDVNGVEIYWDDLLSEGDLVGPSIEEDDTPGEAAYADGIVVRRRDGLWAEKKIV